MDRCRHSACERLLTTFDASNVREVAEQHDCTCRNPLVDKKPCQALRRLTKYTLLGRHICNVYCSNKRCAAEETPCRLVSIPGARESVYMFVRSEHSTDND
jgi:hypothetical protein